MKVGLASIGASFALALAPVSSAMAQTTPAAPAPTETAQLPEGSGRFVFADWPGPGIPVWTFIPEGVEAANAPIAFIMHGARRNADDYRDQWIDEAKAGGFIIVAPEFSKADFPRANGYNLGFMADRETGEPREEALWAFSAIDQIFEAVVRKLGSRQTRYTIYGHSAGSQFVHRFLFFKPQSKAKRFIAANAGWYTLAQPRITFPYGLAGTDVDEARLKSALAKDLVILLGDQDNDPDSNLLNKSEGAMKQGPHRFARGVVFYTTAKVYAEKKGWDFGWSIQSVKGVGHSNRGMAPAASKFVD